MVSPVFQFWTAVHEPRPSHHLSGYGGRREL